MGRLKKTIIHAGAILATTDHDVEASERGNRPLVKIDTAMRWTLTEGTPNTVVSTDLTVVFAAPGADEIWLVDENTIQVGTVHLASQLLIMHAIVGKTILP